MQALILFWKINSEYRSKEIKHYVNKAVIFIENNQKKDGSWFVLLHHLFCINYCHFLLLITKLAIFSTRYGTWGICFVYGTLYAIKGLIAAGRNYENSICIRKACRFLLSTQLKTGGWGESFLSCERQVKSSFQFT